MKDHFSILRVSSQFVPPFEGLGPGPFGLSREQARRQHQVIVIAPWTAGCEEIDSSQKFKTIRIRASSILLFSLYACLKALQLQKDQKLDIIHFHDHSSVFFQLARKLGCFYHARFVSSVHIVRRHQFRHLDSPKFLSSMWFYFKRQLIFENLFFKLSDDLVTVNSSLARELAHEYPRLAPAKVIFNGVDYEYFSSLSEEIDHHADIFSGDHKVLLFIGVLNGRKGELIVIDALDELTKQGHEFRLLVCGDGPSLEPMKRLITKKKLNDSVTIFRNVPPETIRFFYQKSDFFVLASVSEGLPKVVLEAMSAGTPCVLSDIPAHTEVFTNQLTALLSDPTDANGLASSILYLKQNPGVARAMADAARDLVREKFSWRAVADKLDVIYGVTVRR